MGEQVHLLGFSIGFVLKAYLNFGWKEDVAWSKHIYNSLCFFGMTEALAQGEVVLQGIRVLDEGGNLLERTSLLGGDDII